MYALLLSFWLWRLSRSRWTMNCSSDDNEMFFINGLPGTNSPSSFLLPPWKDRDRLVNSLEVVIYYDILLFCLFCFVFLGLGFSVFDSRGPGEPRTSSTFNFSHDPCGTVKRVHVLHERPVFSASLHMVWAWYEDSESDVQASIACLSRAWAIKWCTSLDVQASLEPGL